MISFEPEYDRPECEGNKHRFDEGYCTDCGALEPEILHEKAEQLRQKVESTENQLRDAFESYEKALDVGCECHLDNPGGFCPRCGLIEKARRIATKIIGDYEKL